MSHSQSRHNALYSTMILAWSTTEVIRYAFYALSLTRNTVPGVLVYLRYTTFYLLYPLGAASEALLILSSLPAVSPLEGFRGGSWNVWDCFRGVMFVAWWPGACSRSSLLPNADLWFVRPSRNDVTHGKAAEEGVWTKRRKHKVEDFLRGWGGCRAAPWITLVLVPGSCAIAFGSFLSWLCGNIPSSPTRPSFPAPQLNGCVFPGPPTHSQMAKPVRCRTR